MQITGHMVDEQGNKVAGPTISGSFSGVLTVHFEDGSQRRLWEKDCPAKGTRRCLPAPSPQLSTSASPTLVYAAERCAQTDWKVALDAKICLTIKVLTELSTSINQGCLTFRYQFSDWDASLNEIVQGQRGRLPPSDARFRPDVRAIEDGRFTEVSALKAHARTERASWAAPLDMRCRLSHRSSMDPQAIHYDIIITLADCRPYDGTCQQFKYSSAHA